MAAALGSIREPEYKFKLANADGAVDRKSKPITISGHEKVNEVVQKLLQEYRKVFGVIAKTDELLSAKEVEIRYLYHDGAVLRYSNTRLSKDDTSSFEDLAIDPNQFIAVTVKAASISPDRITARF